MCIRDRKCILNAWEEANPSAAEDAELRRMSVVAVLNAKAPDEEEAYLDHQEDEAFVAVDTSRLPAGLHRSQKPTRGVRRGLDAFREL